MVDGDGDGTVEALSWCAQCRYNQHDKCSGYYIHDLEIPCPCSCAANKRVDKDLALEVVKTSAKEWEDRARIAEAQLRTEKLANRSANERIGHLENLWDSEQDLYQEALRESGDERYKRIQAQEALRTLRKRLEFMDRANTRLIESALRED